MTPLRSGCFPSAGTSLSLRWSRFICFSSLPLSYRLEFGPANLPAESSRSPRYCAKFRRPLHGKCRTCAKSLNYSAVQARVLRTTDAISRMASRPARIIMSIRPNAFFARSEWHQTNQARTATVSYLVELESFMYCAVRAAGESDPQRWQQPEKQ